MNCKIPVLQSDFIMCSHIMVAPSLSSFRALTPYSGRFVGARSLKVGRGEVGLVSSETSVQASFPAHVLAAQAERKLSNHRRLSRQCKAFSIKCNKELRKSKLRALASVDSEPAEESRDVPPSGGYGKSGNESLRVLFAAGGTGGHVYPALAIADEVRRIEPNAEVVFVGSENRLEWTEVPAANYPIHSVPVVSLKRPIWSPGNLLLPLRLIYGIITCLTLLAKIRPHIVVGTGGYVTVPMCLAAAMFRVPVAIQEQNAYAGLANKLLGLFATVVFVAFEAAQKYFPKDRVLPAGNPTRAVFNGEATGDSKRKAQTFFFPDLAQGWEQGTEAEVVVILGGSLGAHALNEAVAGSVNAMLDCNSRMRVVWVSGRQYYDEISARVEEHPRLKILPYLEQQEMAQAYAAANLFVSRAGAITCSELLVTGTPALLVPSTNVADDHQTKNAEAMSDIGAAEIMPENVLSPAYLATAINLLLSDEEKLAGMRKNARKAALPDAASSIAFEIVSLAKQQSMPKTQFMVA